MQDALGEVRNQAVKGPGVTYLPPEITDWLHEVLGEQAPLRVRGMHGSRLASVHSLTSPAGDPLVLRWFKDWPAPFTEEEHPATLARREALALAVLGRSPVPAPSLIAWQRGGPVLLSKRLPGRTRMEPPDHGAIRAVLDELHATPPGDLAEWSYRGYHEGEVLVRPAWWDDHSIWDRARSATETARPVGPPVFLHRDFHAGNLLWTGRQLSGIVDWGQACVGPAEFDAAHWRVNHAILHGCEAIPTEMAGDPAWDIEAAFGIFDGWDQRVVDGWRGPWDHINAASSRRRLEAFVARALAELG